MLYALDKIKDDANCQDIAAHYGWPMISRGSNTFCKCPKHRQMRGVDDNKLDKCVIYDKSFYCYSCGASGGVIDFTMALLEYMNGIQPSFPDTVKEIVYILGNHDSYILSEENETKKKEFPLDNSQLEALGLKKNITVNIPVKNSYEKALLKNEKLNPQYEDRTETYLGYRYLGQESLLKLFFDEPDTFDWLIKNKAREMTEKYDVMLNNNCLWNFFEKLPVPRESVTTLRQFIKIRKGICERLVNAKLITG